MRNVMNSLLVLSILCAGFACNQGGNDAWTAFQHCTQGDCIDEALAVNDAFLKDPKAMLTEFNKTYEKGEDHVIGWIYLMRDSVLLNSNFDEIEARFKLQQAIINAAKPYEQDPKLGEMAKNILDEVEMLAIASELEDEVAPEVPEQPALNEAETKTANSLNGNWKSATDPKSVIRIADGKYTEEYDGKEVSSLPYVFYPTCPQDCSPVGSVPCIKVVGQDDVCYTLVKVDAKNLELSMISGTGNTNRYVRF